MNTTEYEKQAEVVGLLEKQLYEESKKLESLIDFNTTTLEDLQIYLDLTPPSLTRFVIVKRMMVLRGELE